MRDLLNTAVNTVVDTLTDVIPIAVIILAFQYLVIRRPMPHFRKVLTGFLYVLIGLSLFLIGLEQALFPLGRLMAQQLADPAFVSGGTALTVSTRWSNYHWLLLFGTTLGFATALAEPSLIAVAIKANHVSGGTIGYWGIRVAVAIGAAIGVGVGVLRILLGIPLQYIIDRRLYGGDHPDHLRHARDNPVCLRLRRRYYLDRDRTPGHRAGARTRFDHSGPQPDAGRLRMIATTCLFPIITVMAYAQLSQWWYRRTGNT